MQGRLSAAQRLWETPDLRNQVWTHLGVKPYTLDQLSHLLRISRSTFPELAEILYRRFRAPDFDTFRANVPPERRLLYLSFVQYLDDCPFDSRDPPDQFMAEIDTLLSGFPNVLEITSPIISDNTTSLVRTPSVTPEGELPRFVLHDTFGCDIFEIDREQEDLDEDWAIPERITRGGLSSLEFIRDVQPDEPPELRESEEDTERALWVAWEHGGSYFCWGRVEEFQLRVAVDIATLATFLERMERTRPAVLPDRLGVDVYGDVNVHVLWRLMRFASHNLQSFELRPDPARATVSVRPGHLIGSTARRLWEGLGTKCKEYKLPVRAQAPATALPSTGIATTGPDDGPDLQTLLPELDARGEKVPLPLDLKRIDLIYADYNPLRTFGNGVRIPLDVPVMDELADYVLDVWGGACQFRLTVTQLAPGPGAGLMGPAAGIAEVILNDLVQAQLKAMRSRRHAQEAARRRAADPAKQKDENASAPDVRGWRRLEPHERV